jgi:Ca2+-transporting ATPase
MAGILLFLVLFIEFLARLNGPGSPEEKAQKFMRILITAITIIVVAVPEGLPLAVTLALAFATKRMTKENNLVRHLQSCETMGNATVICSDKTGTLTENAMTVVAGSLGAGYLRFGDEENSPAGQNVSINDLSTALGPELQELIKQAIAMNTTAFEREENGKSVFVGTKTETALLDWALKYFGLGPLSIERSNRPVKEVYPFNSQRKCMGTVIELPNGKLRLLVKGAPEILLDRCNLLVEQSESGGLAFRSPHDDSRVQIKRSISGFASRSLRTLGLCYRDYDANWWPAGGFTVELDDVFKGMTWIGTVGIQDPVRKGVPAALEDCRRASVSVKMVTGDNIETARAIAKECGLLTSDNDIVMEGADFRRLSDEQRANLLPDLRVLARSSPEDKRVLVKALQSMHHIVAVTGDGTNDAPALKAADVGFSMGITGTEVAKEASDIILMDDNFSSIVKALAWGRAINDSVKKFLQFQITVNITAVLLTFITAVTSDSERSVLNAVQLLWVNLIMDTFAALALATDPPNGSLLDRKPEPKTAPLINVTMWKMIIGQSMYQLTVALVLYYAGPRFLHYPEAQHRTLIFNTFVFMQIFKLVNSRRIDNKLNILEGLHKNHLFMLIAAVMLGGQILIIFIGGEAIGVEKLDGVQWAISLILGFFSIPMGVLIRLFPDTAFETLFKPFLFVISFFVSIITTISRAVRRYLSKDRDSNKRPSLTDLEADREEMSGRQPRGWSPDARNRHPNTFVQELKYDLDNNLAWWTFRGGRMKHYEEKLKRIVKRQEQPEERIGPFMVPGMLAASIVGPTEQS